MTYVFDSSFAGTLIIPDEKNPRVDEIRSGITEDEEIFVPQLLWYEMGNIFNNLVRRKRYTYDEVLGFIPLLSALRLTGDSETGPAFAENLLRFAHHYGITTYDAAYMELAGRKKAALCTLDGGLQEAAEQYGVVLLR